MTKKHYIIIAKMLNEIKQGNGKGLTLNQKITFNSIVYRLSSIFLEDNKNFDNQKFENAIYEK